MNPRRQFAATTAALLSGAWSADSRAQKKLPMVGVLSPNLRPKPVEVAASALVVRLRELGWENGQSMTWEALFAEGRDERLPELARALVAKKPDVIWTNGSNAVLAAQQATTTIPIVATGPDLLALGLVQSLARPGGNVTGLPNEAGQAVLGKRLELLKRAAPAVRRVTYVRNRRSVAASAWSPEVIAAAQGLGLVLDVAEVDSPEDLDAAFRAFSRNKPDGLWLAGSSTNGRLRARIIEYAARERVPAIFSARDAVESGGLMSYAVNRKEQSRRAAEYIDKILRGARPAELPVELPTRFELVLNLKTAAMLGLKIPQDLLLLADEVIR